MSGVSVNNYVELPVISSGLVSAIKNRIGSQVDKMFFRMRGWQGYSNYISKDEFADLRHYLPERSFSVSYAESKFKSDNGIGFFIRQFSVFWDGVGLKPVINAVSEDPVLKEYFDYGKLTRIITALKNKDRDYFDMNKRMNDSLKHRIYLSRTDKQYVKNVLRMHKEPVGFGWHLFSSKPAIMSKSGAVVPANPDKININFSVIDSPDLVTLIKSFYK